MQPQRHVILSPQNSHPGASDIGDSLITLFKSRYFDLVKACLDVLIFLMISTCLAQPWAPIWKIWKQVWKMICSWLPKTIRNYHIRSYAGMYVEFCRILVVHLWLDHSNNPSWIVMTSSQLLQGTQREHTLLKKAVENDSAPVDIHSITSILGRLGDWDGTFQNGFGSRFQCCKSPRAWSQHSLGFIWSCHGILGGVKTTRCTHP